MTDFRPRQQTCTCKFILHDGILVQGDIDWRQSEAQSVLFCWYFYILSSPTKSKHNQQEVLKKAEKNSTEIIAKQWKIKQQLPGRCWPPPSAIGPQAERRRRKFALIWISGLWSFCWVGLYLWVPSFFLARHHRPKRHVDGNRNKRITAYSDYDVHHANHRCYRGNV